MFRAIVLLTGLLVVPAAGYAQGGGEKQTPDCAQLRAKHPKPNDQSSCVKLTKCHSGWMTGEVCTVWEGPAPKRRKR
jgi:hypothetical protein